MARCTHNNFNLNVSRILLSAENLVSLLVVYQTFSHKIDSYYMNILYDFDKSKSVPISILYC
jgi:hypothetical protein